MDPNEIEESPQFLAEIEARLNAAGVRTYTIEEARAMVKETVREAVAKKRSPA